MHSDDLPSRCSAQPRAIYCTSPYGNSTYSYCSLHAIASVLLCASYTIVPTAPSLILYLVKEPRLHSSSRAGHDQHSHQILRNRLIPCCMYSVRFWLLLAQPRQELMERRLAAPGRKRATATLVLHRIKYCPSEYCSL